MDPEQTFLRVHARLSGVLARLLTPKFRTGLECVCLLNAVMLLALLVIMHVNFVAQPGCAEHFSSKDIAGAQLVQIKITGSWNHFTEDALGRGMWKQDTARQYHTNNELSGQESKVEESYQVPDVGGEGWNILAAKFWLNLLGSNARRNKVARSPEKREIVREEFASMDGTGLDNGLKPGGKLSTKDEKFEHDISTRPLSGPGRGPLGTALLHYCARWGSYGASCFKRAEQSIRSFWQVWRITGWEPFTTTPKLDRRTVTWNKLDAVLVDVPEAGSRLSDPTYLYSIDKGYLMMSEGAKLRHEVKTINISISAQHACFGNRWQQLLIDNFVGYDTILMNSLLNACGRGYLYNFQTKELYNLNYLQDFGGAPHGVEDYLVFKCGVLITSLFVFFTTTMSVSFTLRETQSRMLKFTVQLQHHARHRLPTYRLIFIHVIESLVFVPIMIGILFFLFEFFDDQLLAFMVLTLVWLCELFTMISVRTPLSMQFFPRFFFLYFMVFHIYFFSYTYGFSYLAFSATAALMQHLVMYFWNRFEVPALQIYLRQQAALQQQGVHITSSAILTSVRVTQGNPPNNSTQTIRGLAGLNNLRSAIQTARNPSQGLRTPESDVNPTNIISTPTINHNIIPPGFRSWINNPMHEIDNNSWSRYAGLERSRARREWEMEQDANPLFRGHGLELSGDTQTAPPYESALPWILRGMSFFLPVFHHLGDTHPPSRNTNNDEHGGTTSTDATTTSMSLESGVSQSLEGEGLRHRHVGHPVGEA